MSSVLYYLQEATCNNPGQQHEKNKQNMRNNSQHVTINSQEEFVVIQNVINGFSWEIGKSCNSVAKYIMLNSYADHIKLNDTVWTIPVHKTLQMYTRKKTIYRIYRLKGSDWFSTGCKWVFWVADYIKWSTCAAILNKISANIYKKLARKIHWYEKFIHMIFQRCFFYCFFFLLNKLNS